MNLAFRCNVIARQLELAARFDRLAAEGLRCPPAEVNGQQFPAYSMGDEERAQFAVWAEERRAMAARLALEWLPAGGVQ